MRLRVRVTPRGGADRIEGATPSGELRIRVRAAPVDGAANDAVARLIATELGIRAADVRVVTGQTARTKRIELGGTSAAEAQRRWPGVAVNDS